MGRRAGPSAQQPVTRTIVSDVRLPAVKATDRVQIREIRILPSHFLLSPGQEPELTPLR